MPEETTGQGAPATGTEGGQDTGVLAATLEPGATETSQAGADTAALQAQLEEQRSIQAGLDRRVAQLTAQLGVELKAKEELDAKLQEAQSGTTAGAQELENLRQTLAALEGEKGQWEQQLAASQAHAERLQVVATEYPALAPLVEGNALPQAKDMDEFRQKLGAMATAFNAQATAAYQQMADGVKPPASPPASTQPANLDTIHRDMLAALKEGKTDEYNRLREQWYATTEASDLK
jgi:septal ring factor EnvC (AmiA/AmiB activator)